MNLTKITAFILGLLLWNNGFSQKPDYVSAPLYQHYYNMLRSGNLLVRLMDRATIREKLVKHGETDKLRLFDEHLAAEYKEIFHAFERHYKVGRVYFFLNSQEELLKQGKFSEMQFLDIHGQVVISDKINATNYLIGEFSRMIRVSNGPLIQPKNARNRKSVQNSFSAFVMRDKELNLIPKDYYLHVYTVIRTKKGSIKKLNKRLHRNSKWVE